MRRVVVTFLQGMRCLFNMLVVKINVYFCRKLIEYEAQNNAMREELRKLRAEVEQMRVHGYQADG